MKTVRAYRGSDAQSVWPVVEHAEALAEWPVWACRALVAAVAGWQNSGFWVPKEMEGNVKVSVVDRNDWQCDILEITPVVPKEYGTFAKGGEQWVAALAAVLAAQR